MRREIFYGFTPKARLKFMEDPTDGVDTWWRSRCLVSA